MKIQPCVRDFPGTPKSDPTIIKTTRSLLTGNAVNLKDLRVPPANRLEALKGNRKGQYSIRINDQFRICFRWEAGDSFDVEIVDYH